MNYDFLFDVNEELCKIRATAGNGEISRISKISSDASENRILISSQNDEISKISRISSNQSANLNFSNKDKIKVIEISQLIRSYAKYWGETEENIDEYIQDQLANYLLDDLINCFRSLNADIQKSQPPLANDANAANFKEKYL